MALSDIVSVSIAVQASGPEKPGFGTALIAANKVPAGFTNRVREYASTTELTDAGFLVTDPAYLAAQKYFGQDPKPSKVKVGRRALKTVQTLKIKCLSAIEGDVYKITVNGTALTYTVLAAATTTTVAVAIELLVDAVSGVDSTSATDTITVTVTAGAGNLIDLAEWSSNIAIQDTSADPGIATDLAAFAAEDNEWYGLILDSNSETEVKAAAAYIETTEKIFACNSSDTEIIDAVVTTDVASDLEALAYVRTYIQYSGKQLLSYAGAAMLGVAFTNDPGSDTWHLKTLKGVPVDKLTGGQRSAAIGKHANVYTAIAGLNVTQGGTAPGGQYLDVIRFRDWLKAEIQIRVFAAMAAAKKIPYTDIGVAQFVAIIQDTLNDGVAVGGLAADPAPTVTVSKVADINTVSKGQRKLPGVKFKGTLAGAVHEIEISGEVVL